MAITVTNQSEFESAVDNNASEIVIEGNFANKILIVRATGKVAWIVSVIFFFISLAILTYSPSINSFISQFPPKGINQIVEKPPLYQQNLTSIKKTLVDKDGLPKVLILTLAVSIISCGGALFLSKRNKYHITEHKHNHLILKIKDE